jgi:hypothetical protein
MTEWRGKVNAALAFAAKETDMRIRAGQLAGLAMSDDIVELVAGGKRGSRRSEV